MSALNKFFITSLHVPCFKRNYKFQGKIFLEKVSSGKEKKKEKFKAGWNLKSKNWPLIVVVPAVDFEFQELKSEDCKVTKEKKKHVKSWWKI